MSDPPIYITALFVYALAMMIILYVGVLYEKPAFMVPAMVNVVSCWCGAHMCVNRLSVSSAPGWR